MGKGAAAVGLIVATVTMAVLLFLFVARRGTGEQFTEFYLLGPEGTAEGYPSTLAVGEEMSLTLGIVNQEGRDAVYSLSLLVNDTVAEEIDTVKLRPQERWERPVTFTLTEAGEDQLVQFLLRLDDQTEPYRTLHLWVDGQEATVAPEAEESVLAEAEAPAPADQEAPPAETTPEPEAEPMPEPEAEPTPEPQYELHIVSRGENLTVISRRYGVPLEAVIQANASEIPNPDLIYPDQRILIPVEER